MKKVELLAPAGNYEALTGAFSAGADAVYLGGNAFGARAYADNFTQDEICEGIRYAHIFRKKIYLTVNTLVKEREFKDLYDFLMPLYEAGLDGVIIQDLGVFKFVREHFPGLELHISTQMTITGAYGASMLKKEGASRIVPARELSLSELKAIKKGVDIEIEAFIHGAMCYSYSGQCLFSSILGGRSGNRGRCAQPCRLPYHINNGREGYFLSMKDMCTINRLPELIEAGIDSFKIEGRMKKPEYAAGVTACYRKYIDMYYKIRTDRVGQIDKTGHVLSEDMEFLKSLYIRSGISEGYYHQHNGRNMITLSSPAYTGNNESLLKEIRKKYLDQKMVLPVMAKAVFRLGEPAYLTLTSGRISVSIEGSLVQEARKQPLLRSKIEQQLLKSGGTCFEITSLKVEADENIFLQISDLNRLRRDGLSLLLEKIVKGNKDIQERRAVPFRGCTDVVKKQETGGRNAAAFHVLVNSREQLTASFLRNPLRIYIDRIKIDEEVLALLASYKRESGAEIYLAFPFIVREQDGDSLARLWKLLCSPVFDGCLARNLETLSYLESLKNKKPVVADFNLYAWNQYAFAFLRNIADEVYFPVELNIHEWIDLKKAAVLESDDISAVVYGRVPMMISAECLQKTEGTCRRQSGWNCLSDRYSKKFPVYNDCTYCYNIIYNSVPLSLHKLFDRGTFLPGVCRLDFTVEDGEETEKIIAYFQEAAVNYKEPFYRTFTTGHYKRGVE